MKIKNLFLTVGTMMVMTLATTGCGGKDVSVDLPEQTVVNNRQAALEQQRETTPAPTEAVVVEETAAFVPKAPTYDSYEKALIAEGWADVVPHVIDDVEFLQFDEIATVRDDVPYEKWELEKNSCELALANYIKDYCIDNNFDVNSLNPNFEFFSTTNKVSVDLPNGGVLKLLQFNNGEKYQIVAAVVSK